MAFASFIEDPVVQFNTKYKQRISPHKMSQEKVDVHCNLKEFHTLIWL